MYIGDTYSVIHITYDIHKIFKILIQHLMKYYIAIKISYLDLYLLIGKDQDKLFRLTKEQDRRMPWDTPISGTS